MTINPETQVVLLLAYAYRTKYTVSDMLLQLEEPLPMKKPFVIVVTGRPGSGKTTLAHTLAKHIHCPALCRDEFKEGYVHTMGGTHASLETDINRRLYDIFFETVDFVVSKGVSVVI